MLPSLPPLSTPPRLSTIIPVSPPPSPFSQPRAPASPLSLPLSSPHRTPANAKPTRQPSSPRADLTSEPAPAPPQPPNHHRNHEAYILSVRTPLSPPRAHNPLTSPQRLCLVLHRPLHVRHRHPERYRSSFLRRVRLPIFASGRVGLAGPARLGLRRGHAANRWGGIDTSRWWARLTTRSLRIGRLWLGLFLRVLRCM